MSTWCAERKARGYNPKHKFSQKRCVDSFKEESDSKKEEENEQN